MAGSDTEDTFQADSSSPSFASATVLQSKVRRIDPGERMKEIFRANRDVLAYMGVTLDDVATGTVLCVLARVTNRWRGNDILHPQPW